MTGLGQALSDGLARWRALRAIRTAQARAREQAWLLAGDRAPGVGGGPVTVDIDATIVVNHSDKQLAAPTWKHLRVPSPGRVR